MDASAQALTPDQARVVNSRSWGAGIFGVIYLIAMKAYTHVAFGLLATLILIAGER